MGPTKKINPNMGPEKDGLIYLQQVVRGMNCIFRPTPSDDYGIDGEIEIVDNGTPTGLIIKVQCKSGRSYIANPKFGRFDLYTNERDLNYWSQANVPVVLVVYDPERNTAYWKDVQGYVRLHPDVKVRPHAISFSRRSDVFTRQCYEKLCGLVITAKLN